MVYLCDTCSKADVSCPIYPSYGDCIEYKKENSMMWVHRCRVECTVMSIGEGEECNWCGRSEEDENAEFGKLGPNEFPDDEVGDDAD